MSFHVRWPAPQGLPGRQSDVAANEEGGPDFPALHAESWGRGHYPDAFDFSVWI